MVERKFSLNEKSHDNLQYFALFHFTFLCFTSFLYTLLYIHFSRYCTGHLCTDNVSIQCVYRTVQYYYNGFTIGYEFQIHKGIAMSCAVASYIVMSHRVMRRARAASKSWSEPARAARETPYAICLCAREVHLQQYSIAQYRTRAMRIE